MTYFFFRRLFKSSVDDDDDDDDNDDDGVQVGGGEDELPGECGVARAGQETRQTGSHAPSHTQEAGITYLELGPSPC